MMQIRFKEAMEKMQTHKNRADGFIIMQISNAVLRLIFFFQ